MALPLSGKLSIEAIRQEISQPISNFSLNTAEDQGYVTLNPCSPYLPSVANPAFISEWYGYNHRATCNTTRFLGTISDNGFNASCEDYTNITQANSNIQFFFNNEIINVGTNTGLDKLYINNLDALSYVKVLVEKIATNGVRTTYFSYEGSGVNYVPWDLSKIGGGSASTGRDYYLTISYYDGGWITKVSNANLFVYNAALEVFYTVLPHYSSTLAGACTTNAFYEYRVVFKYPFTVGTPVQCDLYGWGFFVIDNYYRPDLADGYYRFDVDPSRIFHVVSGYITEIIGCS